MTTENIKRRLELQVIDKIEQQVQHCLRSYENDLLEDKLICLVKEWFFKGFFGGIEHIQLKQEQQKGYKND
jgi:hypothetical protein